MGRDLPNSCRVSAKIVQVARTSLPKFKPPLANPQTSPFKKLPSFQTKNLRDNLPKHMSNTTFRLAKRGANDGLIFALGTTEDNPPFICQKACDHFRALWSKGSEPPTRTISLAIGSQRCDGKNTPGPNYNIPDLEHKQSNPNSNNRTVFKFPYQFKHLEVPPPQSKQYTYGSSMIYTAQKIFERSIPLAVGATEKRTDFQGKPLQVAM